MPFSTWKRCEVLSPLSFAQDKLVEGMFRVNAQVARETFDGGGESRVSWVFRKQ